MSDKKKGFFAEFKEFAMRGNVVEMAIGIVIGAAFTAIVTAFVSGIINPLIGLLIGNVDFSDLRIILKPETAEAAEISIKYGLFIQKIFEFLITAFAMFLVVRGMNRLNDLKKKEAEAAPAEPAPEPEPAPQPEDIVLLTEIRDLLKEKK